MGWTWGIIWDGSIFPPPIISCGTSGNWTYADCFSPGSKSFTNSFEAKKFVYFLNRSTVETYWELLFFSTISDWRERPSSWFFCEEAGLLFGGWGGGSLFSDYLISG